MKILKLKELKNKKFHFIGIGGISMSGLAWMLFKQLIFVQGSDESNNDEIIKLSKVGIPIFNKHNKDNLRGIDIVVYSSAISEDNEELVFAKNNNILLLKRAELLGLIASDYETVISIAGSHGKTTTSAMISEIFINAGLNPTIHLGGVLNSINSNIFIGDKKYFITESCEYKNNFLYITPNLSVILNIDADHLDYFKNLENVKKAFFRFSNKTKKGGLNLICSDDFNSKMLLKNANTITFGCKNSNILAKNIKKHKNGQFSFNVLFNDLCLGKIQLNLFGRHNINNALAAVLVGILCGIDFEVIKYTLENFTGVKRRSEFVCEINKCLIFSDYAHHPNQIKQMILVGRGLLKNRGRLTIVFEPHTYSRTQYLCDEFVESFNDVDRLILAPVYAARESETDGLKSEDLKNKLLLKNIKAELFFEYADIKNEIIKSAKPHDVILILGAGSIENLVKMLKEEE